MIIRWFIVLFLLEFRANVAVRLRGEFSPSDFVRLLTKFGIQKTDQHRPDETFGYIFGNVTLLCPSNNCPPTNRTILFLILDYDYFLPMFNRERTQSCSEMMKNIQTIAFDRQCNEAGTEDFWRRVPCPRGQLCPDEDQPKNVIREQQFTFKIRDINQPRFWYLSLVSCYWHPGSCQWEKVNESYRVNYDLWVVNGNPEATSRDNRLEFHFSADMHDVPEIYLTCLLLYLLFPLPFLIMKMRAWNFFQHPILSSYFFFQMFFFFGNLFNFLHLILFAFNGVGLDFLVHLGNLLTIIGESILILLLLFIAKGKLKRYENATSFRFVSFRLVSQHTCVASREKNGDLIRLVHSRLLFMLSAQCCHSESSDRFEPLSNICQLFFLIISMFCDVTLRFRAEGNDAGGEGDGKITVFPSFRRCCMVSVGRRRDEVKSRSLGLVYLSDGVDFHHVLRHGAVSSEINHQRCDNR